VCRASRERLQQHAGNIFAQLNPVTLMALLVALIAVGLLLHQVV
jgi:hypothetical protein